MKKLVFVMPLMTISFLASCNSGGGREDKVHFRLSSEQATTVEDNSATLYVDWKPTSHSIKFDSFAFETEDSVVDEITFDKESEARPMPVTISFKTAIIEDINGRLNFIYEDVTTKTKEEGGFEVTIDVPDATKKWYEYENWWNYCSNGNPVNEATSEEIGKEVTVTIYDKVHKVRLIGVDHIEPKEKVAQAHCTFEFANVITNANGAVTTQWNNKKDEEGSVNNYNFPNSTLNDLLNNTEQDNCILKALPIGLQRVIKEVNKKVCLGKSYSTEKSYKTKLFPLAQHEICDYVSSEGTRYQYYINHSELADRIKWKVGSESEKYGENYWTRSPSSKNANISAQYGCTDGGFSTHDIWDKFAIAPAFCI